MSCKILDEFINEVDDIDRVDRAIAAKLEAEQLQIPVNNAKKNGRYAVESKKISTYIGKPEELIGKTLTIESYEDNKFTNVKVNTVRLVGNSTYRINEKYTVNLAKNVTSDGMNMVTLGSETMSGDKMPMGTISGSVIEELENMVTRFIEEDGADLSAEHKEHLMSIFSMYHSTLMESGKDVEVNTDLFKALEEQETQGQWNPTDGRIKLMAGNQEFNTRTEIFAHELQHQLIHEVLHGPYANKLLTSKIDELREALLKEPDINYKVFLKSPDTATEAQIEYAKKRFDYIFNNKADVAYSEFLVGITTNEQLVKKLGTKTGLAGITLIDKIDVSKDKKPKTWKKLLNAIIDIINNAYRNIVVGPNAKMYAIKLLNQALQHSQGQKNWDRMSIYEKAISKILNADKRLAEFTKKSDMEIVDYKELLKRQDKLSTHKVINRLWRIKGLEKVRSAILQNNIFNSLTRDMSDPMISKFYQMYRHAKAFVENNVRKLESATIDVLTSHYGLDKIDIEKRKAAKRVLLDLDLKVLGNVTEIGKYLDSQKLTQQELERLTKELSPEVVLHIDALAELLVTNKMTVRNGYTNAEQMAFGLGLSSKIDELDKAISLRAIEIMRKQNPNTIVAASSAIKENTKGLQHIINLLEKEEELLVAKAYGGDWSYRVKGQVQEKYKGNKAQYYVDEKEARQLVKAGMHNLGKQEDLSIAIGKDVYLVIGNAYEASFTEGLMSKVQLRNEGESLRNMLLDMTDMTEDEVEDRIAELVEIFKVGQSTQALIPERSGLGEIYDYKIRLPYDDKLELMGLNDDIIVTTARTMANLTHKQEAMINNRASIIHFQKMYSKYKDNKDYKFIEISKNSKGKYLEYWNSLPYYMKKQVDETMDGKLMIEESLLTDYFGYKDVSIVNLPLIRNSKKRQIIMKNFEDVIKEVSKSWKEAIVTKTLATVKGNMFSNYLVAAQHTEYKNPVEYLSRFRRVWSDMNQYHKWQKQVASMEIKLAAGDDSVNQKDIDNLKTKMSNSIVHPFIEDGQYSVIMEDISKDWFDEKGIIEERLDAVLSKIKLGKHLELKKIVDELYIRKDASTYESVMKFTRYSDLVNKVIINESLKVTNKEMNERDRLNYLDQLHVNYSYLDNRWIKYANDMLIFSFTKYFFRVLPAMLKMVSKKSASMFITESIQAIPGIDLETPMDQFYNPFTNLTRKIGAWGDPLNIFEHILTVPVAR